MTTLRSLIPPSLLLSAVFAAGIALGARQNSRTETPAEVVRVRGDDASGVVSPAPAEAAAAVGNGPPSSPGRRVAASALSITVVVRGEHVYGAGIVIGARHVLTCRHVVEGLRSIEVTLADGTSQLARVVEDDPALDLTVLELTTPAAHSARLASVTVLEMGDRVYGMGAPKNLSFSFNTGIVSYLGRSYDGVAYLQTDIATNPGNSGGPVLDDAGRVVGVASFILRETQGLAFAIPIDYAHRRFSRYFEASLDTAAFDAWLGAHGDQATRPSVPLRTPGRKSPE